MDRDPASEPPQPSESLRKPIGHLTPVDLCTGGVLKSDPEDFIVEEIPAYLPAGSGEHLYLWIEKRDLSADLMLDRLAKGLGVSRNDIGAAGIKDRRAVTRQWLSVPARCEPALAGLEIEGFRILDRARHGNKLRTGHLKGNRFEIRLRDVVESAAGAADRIADLLRESGVPNLYGDQRFGLDNQTLELGLALLRGEKAARSIPFARRKFLLRLALSSVQSALFNDLLAARLADGTLNKVQFGDVLQVVASGGCFVAEDAAVEQARCDAGETVITGPMFGPRMKLPTGEAAALEGRILEEWRLKPEMFERFPDLTSGTRRPLLVSAGNLEARVVAGSLELRFDLPSGAYATSVTREFQKLDEKQG